MYDLYIVGTESITFNCNEVQCTMGIPGNGHHSHDHMAEIVQGQDSPHHDDSNIMLMHGVQ